MEYHQKVCSSHALFPFAAARTASQESAQRLAAVVLLNSPHSTPADLDDYLSLWCSYRRPEGEPSRPLGEEAAAPAPCGCTAAQRQRALFVCGDGAFERLQAHVAAGLQQRRGRTASSPPTRAGAMAEGRTCAVEAFYRAVEAAGDRSAAPVLPLLCDVVIGDLDSLALEHLPASPPLSLAEVFEYDAQTYATVAAVPDELLDRIHARCCGEVRPSSSPRPLLVPIACQLTSDFHKCISLVQRMRQRFPAHFAEWHLRGPLQASQLFTAAATAEPSAPSSSGVESCPLLLATRRLADAQRTRLCAALRSGRASAERDGSANTTATTTITAVDTSGDADAPMRREAARKLSLLEDTSPDAEERPSAPAPALRYRLHTHVLPSVAVLGALGARFDHEMAAISTIVEFAAALHVVLVNGSNVIFACWPDGVTTWLPMVSSPPAQATAEHAAGPANRAACVDSSSVEGPVCGVIALGSVVEMETAGLLYDIVKGRAGEMAQGVEGRYDGVTQTEQFTFAFGKLISTSNAVADRVVTVDLRPLLHSSALTAGGAVNPPTIVSCNRT